jgi:uroporphyrinogen decarboxylase
LSAEPMCGLKKGLRYSKGGVDLDSRERFLLAAEHKVTDRVPFDIGTHFYMPEVVEGLKKEIGAETIEDIYRFLGIDRRHVEAKYTGPEKYDEEGRLLNLWGIPYVNGNYSAAPSPLAHAQSIDEVESYPWPSVDWFDFSHIEKQCGEYAEYAVSGGFWGPILSRVNMLMGMQNAMIAMYERPEIVKAIAEKIADFFYEGNKRFFEAAREKVDVFLTAEDLGTQRSLLISIDMFREFFFDQHKRMIDAVKPHVKKVMFHSCGSVAKYIPVFIDMGVTILNPVQVAADGMEPADLKQQFGDRICFHGSIDTQYTLPFGSEEDVRREVRDRIRVLGKGGGFVLAPSQDFLPDVPVRNILAMYDEGKKYKPEG